ncbi:hypothetical protein D3C87_351630 [compost metagenome]
MDFSILVKKYGITDSQIDSVMSCMMEGADLTDTIRRSGLNLGQEQMFAIATFISKSFFGEPIDTIAPAMLLERMEIASMNSEAAKAKINREKEIKRLRSIEEDLMLYCTERISVNE